MMVARSICISLPLLPKSGNIFLSDLKLMECASATSYKLFGYE
jgi:hypothetical protein